MKLIKQLETHRNHTLAQYKTYHNVTFPKGFVDFLDGLYFARLSPRYFQRKVVEGQHCWFDDVGDGGIMLATTEHPMSKNNFAGDVTVCGSKDALVQFETILRLHEAEHEGVTKSEPIEVQSAYHDELNPKLWDGNKLKSDVKAKLTKAADAFKKFLKIDDLKIEDVVFTGSNANYNWTDASDIDVHLIVNFADVEAKHGDLVEEYFNAKKNVFNNLHDVNVHGHEVEFYVQDADEPHIASGLYSVQNNEWIKEPEHKEPDVDDAAVRNKTAEMMRKIDSITGDCNRAAVVEALMEKIKKMRQAGLDASGEFSTENLVFKALRHNGYLEKLATCKTKAFDRELSIEDEEWNWDD